MWDMILTIGGCIALIAWMIRVENKLDKLIDEFIPKDNDNWKL